MHRPLFFVVHACTYGGLVWLSFDSLFSQEVALSVIANLAGDEGNGALLMGSVELITAAMLRHGEVVGVQEQALRALGGIAGTYMVHVALLR